jgi:hypothetical protein
VAHSEPLARNRVVGYLGGLVIYSGAVLGGFMLCALLVHHGRVWIVTVEAVVFIAYLLVTILQVRHIMKYSELTAVGAAAQVTGPIRVPPSGRP